MWEHRLRDPVPLMVGAAVLAAAGPPLVRGLRSLPRWLKRPRRLGRAAGAGSLAIKPDGALEDERVLRAARPLLAAWRAGEDGGEAEASVVEAALGLACLEYVSSRVDDAVPSVCSTAATTAPCEANSRIM